ncbi:hypothetical protein [Vallitalea sp.]|jgi:hypothetical protein|uniref:hypothetical protein n=1 Tax=Vallitalea sp. TaxID=1882829 RepID=UPI0025D4E3D9|nr:hypothetical protein [Vallitalea sp.]MCT4686389.1 hypothetical protein [Vallitalea sp.]
MIGTKYHLDIKTGMISYNGQSTNNSISEESQWEIKYKYDLEKMKQLRIDAKNRVNNILIQQGVDLNHKYVQKLNQKINFMENPITIDISKRL